MEDKKVDELLLKLDVFINNIKNDKVAAKQFLQNVGIIDKDGNLAEGYKNLCIPQEQA